MGKPVRSPTTPLLPLKYPEKRERESPGPAAEEMVSPRLRARRSRASRLSPSQREILPHWKPCRLLPASKNNVKVKLTSYNPPSNDISKSQETQNSLRMQTGPYNLRKNVSFNCNDDYDEDSLVYCIFCKKVTEGLCSIHQPVLVLDKDVPRDGTLHERALKTTPWPLRVSSSSIKGAGLGVFTDAHLPAGIFFGPYEGWILLGDDEDSSPYTWEIVSTTHKNKRVDSWDPTISNWLRFVNCSRSEQESNLEGFQYKGNIYYLTRGIIKKGTELLIWYGDIYGKELQDRHKDGNTSSPELSNAKWRKKVKQKSDKVLSLSQHVFNSLFIPVVLTETFNGCTEVLDAVTQMPLDKAKIQSEFLKKKKKAAVDPLPALEHYKKYDSTVCHQCNRRYRGMCSEHPMLLLVDTQVPRDGSVEHRAKETAPWPLAVKVSPIGGAGDGVITSARLPKGLVLGPCEGWVQYRKEGTSGYSWEIEGRPTVELDASDTSVSNWTRYLNCPRSSSEQNLVPMQLRGELFYVVSEDIEKGEELLVWYGETYGNWVQLQPKSKTSRAKKSTKKNKPLENGFVSRTQTKRGSLYIFKEAGDSIHSQYFATDNQSRKTENSQKNKSSPSSVTVKVPSKYPIVIELQDSSNQKGTSDADSFDDEVGNPGETPCVWAPLRSPSGHPAPAGGRRHLSPILRGKTYAEERKAVGGIKILTSKLCAIVVSSELHGKNPSTIRSSSVVKVGSPRLKVEYEERTDQRNANGLPPTREVSGDDASYDLPFPFEQWEPNVEPVEVVEADPQFQDSLLDLLKDGGSDAVLPSPKNQSANMNSLFLPGDCARTQAYDSLARCKSMDIVDLDSDVDIDDDTFEMSIYDCRHCTRRFTFKYNLISHMAKCTGNLTSRRHT